MADEEPSTIRDEIRWLKAEADVTIATRHITPVDKAPSIVTVITADEIKNQGFRTLVEILRIVPGFEILKDESFGAVFPIMRGLNGSEHIRLMINGHFVNSPFGGAAFIIFDDFPIENIKKIEIIRGPGSAIYGENAFFATINIITKNASDIDGVKLSGGYGSFDTHEENILFGKNIGEFGISGLIHYRETNGFDDKVDSDFQTILDNTLAPYGFPAVSKAPGSVDDWRREYDLNFKLTYKDFYLEGLYINKNEGPFIGPQFALTDGSNLESNYVYAEAGYKKTFENTFTLQPRFYYDQFDNHYEIESLPDGTTLPIDVNGDGLPDYTYPEGFFGDAKAIQKVVGADIPANYELFYGNIFTLGLEFRLINQTNVHYSTIFNPETLQPLDSLQNFSDTYPFIKEVTRRIWSVYLQDAWDITDTLNFTFGVRYDDYSDFGDEISPRAGLSWSFMKNATLKILYGEAFRAPNFVELYTTNQPTIQGNKNLDPQTTRTYEIGLNYQFNKYVKSNINYFYSDIEDLILLRTLPLSETLQRFENTGDANIQGIEFETRVDISPGSYVFMNYTFQDTNDDRGRKLPFVAKHKGNFGVNVNCWKYINTNLSTFVSGRRSREKGDPREDLPSFALVNLSFVGKEFFNTMEVQGSVYNLFDKDYSDPGPIFIQDDLPRPGRTFFIGLSYQF